jgi:hypothetical protein
MLSEYVGNAYRILAGMMDWRRDLIDIQVIDRKTISTLPTGKKIQGADATTSSAARVREFPLHRARNVS